MIKLKMKLNHALILMAYCIFFIAISNCSQNKKLEEDLGSKVSNEEYKKVVVGTWGNPEIGQIKKNDYAYVEKSVGINNGILKKVLGKGMTITNVVEASDHTDYHLVISSEEVIENQPSKMSSRERVLSVEKKGNKQENILSQTDLEDDIQTTPFENFIYVLSLCGFKNVECYKLKVEDFKEEVPVEIKKQNCRHFENCEWSGKKVSVVLKVTSLAPDTNESKTANNIISYKIVNNVGYLFKMVEYCFEGMSEFQNQKFPIKICQQVKDAIFGN